MLELTFENSSRTNLCNYKYSAYINCILNYVRLLYFSKTKQNKTKRNKTKKNILLNTTDFAHILGIKIDKFQNLTKCSCAFICFFNIILNSVCIIFHTKQYNTNRNKQANKQIQYLLQIYLLCILLQTLQYLQRKSNHWNYLSLILLAW